MSNNGSQIYIEASKDELKLYTELHREFLKLKKSNHEISQDSPIYDARGNFNLYIEETSHDRNNVKNSDKKIIADLSEINFTSEDDINLTDADLSYSKMSSAEFNGLGNIKNANFDHSDIQGAGFYFVDFKNTNFKNAIIEDCMFIDVKFDKKCKFDVNLLDKAKFSRTNISELYPALDFLNKDSDESDEVAKEESNTLYVSAFLEDFIDYAKKHREALLKGDKEHYAYSNFNYYLAYVANLKGKKVIADVVDLELGKDGVEVDLTGANFSGSLLRKMKFHPSVKLNHICFRNTNLTATEFIKSSGKYIDFRESDLSQVRFMDTKLQHLKFAGAKNYMHARINKGSFDRVLLEYIETTKYDKIFGHSKYKIYKKSDLRKFFEAEKNGVIFYLIWPFIICGLFLGYRSLGTMGIITLLPLSISSSIILGDRISRIARDSRGIISSSIGDHLAELGSIATGVVISILKTIKKPFVLIIAFILGAMVNYRFNIIYGFSTFIIVLFAISAKNVYSGVKRNVKDLRNRTHTPVEIINRTYGINVK